MCECDASAKARIMSEPSRADRGFRVFFDAIQLASQLKLYADSQSLELLWQYALQMMPQLDDFCEHAISMLAAVIDSFPDAPYNTL